MSGRTRRALWIAIALIPIAIAACSERKKAPPPAEPEAPQESAPKVDCSRTNNAVVCAGNWAATCGKKGEPDVIVNCRLSGRVCSPALGCRACVAGTKSCGESNNVVQCRSDGNRYDEVETCDATEGKNCSLESASCRNLCEEAAQSHSYIGCEYWAVPTINSQLGTELYGSSGQAVAFAFAVVIANPQAVAAEVTVERRDAVVASQTVHPGQVEVIELDRIAELAGQAPNRADQNQTQYSVKVPQGAYRVWSTVPVTAYQFNPLEYREGSGTNVSFSYTNDASLLLPTEVLSGNYIVVSRPTLLTSQQLSITSKCGGAGQPPCSQSLTFANPGFVAIVGVEEAPTTVEIALTSYTAPSDDTATADAGPFEEPIAAFGPGDVYRTTLEKGEVLQLVSAVPDSCEDSGHGDKTGGCYDDPESGEKICAEIQYKYCMVGADHDLTGSSIKASGKVAVISGHDCAFIPYYRWACDHIEESSFPLETWGKEVFVSIAKPVRKEPNVIRILSSTEGTNITFTPNVYESTTLDKGQYIEFTTNEHFHVKASAAISVAQFLVGQDYEGIGKLAVGAKGDPSLTFGIPSEQWRTRYSFLAPSTFPDNYVSIIANVGQTVILDGEWVGEWNVIEGTGMAVSHVEINGGSHTVESSYPFGMEVYGYASYTSYMYPGGLDLRVINLLL